MVSDLIEHLPVLRLTRTVFDALPVQEEWPPGVDRWKRNLTAHAQIPPIWVVGERLDRHQPTQWYRPFVFDSEVYR